MANIQNVLGNNVRRLRNRNCWSQVFLADRLNVSVSFVSIIESGQRGVSLSLIESIASVFGVSVPYLFTDHDEPCAAASSISNDEMSEMKDELKKELVKLVDDFFRQKQLGSILGRN